MQGFMADGDAWKERNAAIRGVAIAWLKVRRPLRESNTITAEQDGVIAAWMDDIAGKDRKNVEDGPCGANICGLRGHSGLSVAMAAASVGIAADDPALFRWAIAQYHHAVASIDDRGMLHYDAHGKYALNFTITSAASLVQIAEFGEANGIPMYAYDNGRIHLLIHTVARGLVDPGPFSDAARTEQKTRSPLEPWEITWAAVYERRFPDPVIAGLLQQIGPTGADMWGGEPPFSD